MHSSRVCGSQEAHPVPYSGVGGGKNGAVGHESECGGAEVRGSLLPLCSSGRKSWWKESESSSGLAAQ